MARKPDTGRTPPPLRKAPAPKKSVAAAPAVTPRRQPAPAVEVPARSDMRLTLWVAGAIVLIDQALKFWVVHVLELDRLRAIDLLPPWLNLRMAWNQGVNFGLFSSDQDVMRWVLVAVALGVCLWVWLWLRRGRPGLVGRIAAGLLIGGAVGNVIDRIAYGAVADFLNMSLPAWQNPYSFNIADIAIFAGAFGLVLMPGGGGGAGGGASGSAGGEPRGAADGGKRPSGDNTRDGAAKSR